MGSLSMRGDKLSGRAEWRLFAEVLTHGELLSWQRPLHLLSLWGHIKPSHLLSCQSCVVFAYLIMSATISLMKFRHDWRPHSHRSPFWSLFMMLPARWTNLTLLRITLSDHSSPSSCLPHQHHLYHFKVGGYEILEAIFLSGQRMISS